MGLFSALSRARLPLGRLSGGAMGVADSMRPQSVMESMFRSPGADAVEGAVRASIEPRPGNLNP